MEERVVDGLQPGPLSLIICINNGSQILRVCLLAIEGVLVDLGYGLTPCTLRLIKQGALHHGGEIVCQASSVGCQIISELSHFIGVFQNRVNMAVQNLHCGTQIQIIFLPAI